MLIVFHVFHLDDFEFSAANRFRYSSLIFLDSSPLKVLLIYIDLKASEHFFLPDRFSFLFNETQGVGIFFCFLNLKMFFLFFFFLFLPRRRRLRFSVSASLYF